ncbi:hypothetical protein EZS27_032755, partial [termite gut metagenome]
MQGQTTGKNIYWLERLDIIPISVFVVQKIVFFKKNHIGIQENTTKRITVPQFDGIIT